MTYTAAALLGVAAALAVDLAVLRTRLVTRAVFWATYPIIVGFQLLSNGVLTGRDVVRYRPDAILGWRIASAPVEDLLFGFALVLFSLSVWVWLGRRGVQRTPAAQGRPRFTARRARPGASTATPAPPAPRSRDTRRAAS
ncbi:lycopene cyclase domain-containing protein [Rhizomonospora bruguierae]|uniref:lycopene cyclase domain-containing protein n=1 Tax=Rhizomonospora bruguierae TaxID=1581705 RepID=UPI001BD170A7|nr:lycopene cyclase domain-containing protein [Micromonospora sp. NBRC 107566]